MINTDPKKIHEVVTRGVERVYPNEKFLQERLSSGEQLTIYLGIDPTGPTLHVGHVIPLNKLSQLQKLGHKIILLIGDFTARIGDPDKKSVREQLSHEQVLKNAQKYKEQASLFLDFEGENKAELTYNGAWLDTMTFKDVINLASRMTVQQMMSRDMFKKRSEEGNPIYLHEFMYPLMQGYDSMVMDVDGEVGGNDQTFNMLVGRDLMKTNNPPKEKFVIPMKLLVDNEGNKMGKTTGNMISFLDSADEMFKKIMTWSDDVLLDAFELLTAADLDHIKERIEGDENPRDIKFDLAHEIVSIFHGEQAAVSACDTWKREVQSSEIPEKLEEVSQGETLIDTLVHATSESKSQVRRLITEGAVRVNGEVVSLDSENPHAGGVIQVGKKRWYKLV
jgi:tyrosyl-tRNA synthetase